MEDCNNNDELLTNLKKLLIKSKMVCPPYDYESRQFELLTALAEFVIKKHDTVDEHEDDTDVTICLL